MEEQDSMQGAAGVDFKFVIAKSLVGVKEFKSVLKLGLKLITGCNGDLRVYNGLHNLCTR
jgi:hypothetical protein